MFVRTKKRGSRTYLMIVENEWIDGRVHQRVLHSLGRLDVLQQTGQLDGLLLSLERFSEKLAVLGDHARGEGILAESVKIGPPLLFERLWRDVGIGPVLSEFLTDRKFGMSVERAVFLTVLHRLVSPGSDRAAEVWKEGYRIEGAEGIELQHLYRAMGWLGEALATEAHQSNGIQSPRCMKDRIEEALFARRRDLLTSLSLVFFDTTSIYFEGEGGETIGQYGYSKDHRPDLKQMVVGVVLDGEGHPICSELVPGNTTDVTRLVPVADRLKHRFGIEQVCIVADRGMISEKTMRQIEARGWRYILGVRMRRSKEAREEVLGRGGRYEEVVPKGRDYPAEPGLCAKDPAPLKVKEVRVDDRRYVVCLNEDQATKDRADREAILAGLRKALRAGEKSLIGNKGYRRFLRASGPRFEIDEEKVKEEARYDGKWVLTTNTDLSAADVALQYKRLWMVESIFRSMKSVLETRPIWHKCDDTIRGHVFCSFLAILVRKELEDRLQKKGWRLEWADVIRDVDQLTEMEMTIRGKRYCVRSETKGVAGKVFQACGVALPPVFRPC